MFTSQMKLSGHSLDDFRACTPEASAEAIKKVVWVVNELIQTEFNYLKSLRDIKEGYYVPLTAENKFDASTLDAIFSNIVQLHTFHQIFLDELSRNQENLVGLADVFLEHAVDFEHLYVEFCTEHSLSIRALEQESQSQTKLWESISKCQSRLGHLLPLASYLLKPVQRVLKYQLLLQELVKGYTLANLESEHGDDIEETHLTLEHLHSALERMIQVANHINEAKRRHELIDQLRAGGLEVSQWGRLLLRDVFRLPAKKQACRLVLLFERAILLAKKFSYAGANSTPNLTGLQSSLGEGLQPVLEIRDIISCNNLMLIECIDKNPLAFHILPFNNPNAQKTLQASSLDVKQLWCREIKRVILENFDAAIPEKAKHLMLHMDDLCPRSTKTSDSTNHHHSDDLEEQEQITRRKGPSVLTSIFKRRNRLVRASSTKPRIQEASNSIFTTASVTPSSNDNRSDSDLNDIDPSGDSGDTDHVALVQDAWNALMAKHSTSTSPNISTLLSRSSTQPIPISPGSGSSHEVPNSTSMGVEIGGDDDDFRCIAVEINEERFAVDLAPQLSPRSPPPPKPPPAPSTTLLMHKPAELKASSPPKAWKVGSPSQQRQQGGASIYIDCQDASQYDTVTFGRAYEQYIAKTRSMATLSPHEVDEILRPLLTLVEENELAGLSPTLKALENDDADDRLLPRLASSEDCSEESLTDQEDDICRLVSRIAIEHSLVANKTNGGGGNAVRKMSSPASRRTHRPAPPAPISTSTISRCAMANSYKMAPPPPRPLNVPSGLKRVEAAKPTTTSTLTAQPLRKYSAPLLTKTLQSKPPRSSNGSAEPLAVNKIDTTASSMRSNLKTNGVGSRSVSRSNGKSHMAPMPTESQIASARKSPDVSVCQGCLRAAVATLNPLEARPNGFSPHKPNKPPRRSLSTTRPLEMKGVTHRPSGNVRNLIDRFQYG